MRILITGVAGFIGFHLACRLLELGHEVIGYDGITSYYDPALKRRRLEKLKSASFSLTEAMLEDRDRITALLAKTEPDVVIHLAAQAGVRYSNEHPETYIQSNLVGTFNLLDACAKNKPRHLLIASTSSVYGGNQSIPFREIDAADWPVSLYAATKKAAEALSHSYAHLHRIPMTCFRFFTVYGPWGRPDMALFKFVSAIEKSEPIDVYGYGAMRRDFTYVRDVVDAIVKLIDVIPASTRVGPLDSLSAVAPWRSVNIGGGNPVDLRDFISIIESVVRRRATTRMHPMQPGDVVETFASSDLLELLTGYRPETTLVKGVTEFVRWYREYYPAATEPA
jgi:UDP-glucuronate 4-epimerase